MDRVELGITSALLTIIAVLAAYELRKAGWHTASLVVVIAAAPFALFSLPAIFTVLSRWIGRG